MVWNPRAAIWPNVDTVFSEMRESSTAFVSPIPLSAAAPVSRKGCESCATSRRLWECVADPGARAAHAPASVPTPALRPIPGRDFYGIPNPGPGSRLLLADLRERLIRQEETIIFALIERAQFQVNGAIYEPDAFDLPAGSARTFLEYLLHNLEAVYATVRRYTSPDEHAFTPGPIPEPILSALDYPQTLVPNDINANERILRAYIDDIVPAVCAPGDDQNYGSAATTDVACLQALSKRVHYGKFIAEAKVQQNEAEYAALALAGDRDGVYRLLSDATVEEVLLRRVRNKAMSYGSDITGGGVRDVYKVRPEVIARMYSDIIIPLTKEVEIDYIIHRCAK